MEEILLSDKIKDYKIDFAERDADFHTDRFHYHHTTKDFLLSETAAPINHSITPPGSGRFVLIPQPRTALRMTALPTAKRHNYFSRTLPLRFFILIQRISWSIYFIILFFILLLCFRTMPPAYLIPCIRKPPNRTPVVAVIPAYISDSPHCL